jgi:co-chaperonin GroES (HSP10)|tara:strand:+ start:297 stop:584 length:288 start_codon:yes stop_codon:yes gene_type:complete
MFKPVNRYIYIEVPETKPNETSSGIVLPDDYKPQEERHGVVSVKDWAEDVKFKLKRDQRIIIDRSMIEEVTVYGEKVNLILENYVLGVIPSANVV